MPHSAKFCGMDKEPTWQQRIDWCKSAGMTSEKIAADIGLTTKGLWEIENGRTKAPNGMVAVHLHTLSEKCKRKLARA